MDGQVKQLEKNKKKYKLYFAFLSMKKKVMKKPWGKFEQFTLNEKTTVKVHTVKPGKRLSLQRHKHRTEMWRFLDNPARVTLGKKMFRVKKGDEIFIKKLQFHRIEALSKPIQVLEINWGEVWMKGILKELKRLLVL